MRITQLTTWLSKMATLLTYFEKSPAKVSRGVSKGGLRGLEHPPDQMENFFLAIIYMGMLPDRVKQERWISKLTCALIQVSAQLEKKLVFTLADSIQPF